MNVFIVLLATVSAGDSGGGPVVHSMPAATSSCGGCCGTATECCVTECCEKPKKHSFFSRKKAKPECCDCVPTCCAPAAEPCCGSTSSCVTCCEETHKKPRFSLFKKKKPECCPPCDSCGCDHGHTTPVHAAPSHGGPVHTMPMAPSHGGTIITPGVPLAPGTGAPAGKAVEPIKKMPKDVEKKDEKKIENKGATLAPMPTVTPTGARIETEAKNPFDLARRYDQRVAHAADYSKLTGQLFYVHADGGLWVLRYAPLAEEDANGGSVVLARDRVMNNYREGDLITVEGRVISKKGSLRLGGPLYQVNTIRLVDRPQ